MFGFAEGVRAVGPELGETYETGRTLVVGDRPMTSFHQTEDALYATGALLTWLHVGAVAAASCCSPAHGAGCSAAPTKQQVRTHG